MRDLLPILKSFKKSKAGAVLLTLQIAVTFMVMVNAAFMVSERSKDMNRPSGVDEQGGFYVLTNLQGKPDTLGVRLDEDLAMLRSIDGVKAVTPITGLPLEGWGRYLEYYLDPNGDNSAAYGGYFGADEHVIEALGLELIAGEPFAPSDVQTVFLDGQSQSANVLITQALAERLYPDNWRDALGTTLYLGKVPQQITGVVATMQNAWHNWSGTEFTVISPVREAYESVRYFFRAEPAQVDRVMQQVLLELQKTPGRIIEKAAPYGEVKQTAYQEDTATSKLLFAVCTGLLIVTGLGIFGQARFSVNRRKKHIGTRRALGASKGQVVSYFMLENAVISVCGVALGILAAVVLSNQFVNLFDLTPVPGEYLVFGSIGLIALGQLAVMYPAFQAASIDPAITTRSA